jgi:hypothetical protein
MKPGFVALFYSAVYIQITFQISNKSKAQKTIERRPQYFR